MMGLYENTSKFADQFRINSSSQQLSTMMGSFLPSALFAVASLRAPYLDRCCSCSTPPTWVSLLPVSASHPTSMPTTLSFTRGGPPSTVAQQRYRMELGIERIAEWMRSNRLRLN